MTLKARLSLSFIGYALSVIAFFGGAYYFAERKAARRALAAEQKKTADQVASVCQGIFYAGPNAVMALHYIGVVTKDPAVLSVACLDPRGLVQAHSDPRRIGRASPDAESLKTAGPATGERSYLSAEGTPVQEWTVPVLAGGAPVGFATIAYDPRILEAQVRQRLLATSRQLAFVAGYTLLAAVLLSLLLAASLLRPIQALVQAVRAVAAGRLETRTAVSRRGDELGFLGAEVNAMAGQLKKLNDLKDELILDVSHDLRSPITAMRMQLEHMLEKDRDKDVLLPKHRGWLNTVMHHSVRLQFFITNMLDGAKLKAGFMEYRLHPVDLCALASDLAKLLQVVALTQEVALETDFPAGLPKVLADPARLEQALTNLLSNALKFTKPGGKVTLGARRQGSTVEIFVADTGKGIAAADLPKLFRRFTQLNEAGVRKGTGLGLFIVKETVEAMGGQVAVESATGKGTRFTVRLPAAPEGEAHG